MNVGDRARENAPTATVGAHDAAGRTTRCYAVVRGDSKAVVDSLSRGTRFVAPQVVEELLEDPENLFAAQNVLPLIRSDAGTPQVAEALNAVSAKLDTATLTELLTKVTVDKQDSAQVAQEWVAQNLGAG